MKDNVIDVVIGPIETYEDQLFGYKAAFEAFVLIKDLAWSERLARYAAMLPELQRGLPVPEEYKQEMPGTDSDLNAYDVVYYAGDCNAGSKTIAINLPNDEQVQLQKGSRRLQLKNAMRAKFDKILVPIAEHADRRGPARARHLRRLLRQHHVPRGGPRPGHQEHPGRQRHGARGAAGAGLGARGGQGGHPRPVHGHQAARAGRAGRRAAGGLLRHLHGRHLPLQSGSAPPAPTAGPT